MIMSAADQVTYPTLAHYVRHTLPGVADSAVMARA